MDLGEEADARLVFHYVKLLGLIYKLEPTTRGYRLRLDGPLSIFGATRKYGLRLAKFLPGLLLTSPWKLSAQASPGRAETQSWSSTPEMQRPTSHYMGPAGRARGRRRARGVRPQPGRERRKPGGWELETGAAILPFPRAKDRPRPGLHPAQRRDRREGPPGGPRLLVRAATSWSGSRCSGRPRAGHRVLIAASERLGASPETLSEAEGGCHPVQGPPGREVRARGAGLKLAGATHIIPGMERSMGSLVALTVGCTFAADYLRVRGRGLLVAERLRGLGREPLIQATRLLVYVALGVLLAFRGGWHGVLAAVAMALGATLPGVGALPVLLRVGRPRGPGGLRGKFGGVQRPTVRPLDHLRHYRGRDLRSPRPGPAHDGPRQPQGSVGRTTSISSPRRSPAGRPRRGR